jgi:hypothetical protein
VRSEALSVEHEALGALGEALGDDLGVERVGEDLRPVLECAVRGDRGRATVVVALGDHLEGELRLRGVHLEHGEVVHEEEVGADVLSERALQATVQLGAVEVVQHLRRAHEDDAAVRLASAVRERASEEGLAGAGQADEERVHALLDEGEIVEREVAVAELLAHGAEVEVEPVDGVWA